MNQGYDFYDGFFLIILFFFGSTHAYSYVYSTQIGYFDVYGKILCSYFVLQAAAIYHVKEEREGEIERVDSLADLRVVVRGPISMG